jgi:hypothetical protein
VVRSRLAEFAEKELWVGAHNLNSKDIYSI